jgi:hypothetical protein
VRFSLKRYRKSDFEINEKCPQTHFLLYLVQFDRKTLLLLLYQFAYDHEDGEVHHVSYRIAREHIYPTMYSKETLYQVLLRYPPFQFQHPYVVGTDGQKFLAQHHLYKVFVYSVPIVQVVGVDR